ncbi:MAG: sulfur carrier protein ThiS [Gammaproteobacteria bacterium]|nr:sulfur carrier protein ThiS [Gammaproteobacteria bacterium]
MQVTINGEQRDVPAGLSVAELLLELGYGERRVAVERNADIVPRSQHDTTRLEENDSIEIIQAIGGG